MRFVRLENNLNPWYVFDKWQFYNGEKFVYSTRGQARSLSSLIPWFNLPVVLLVLFFRVLPTEELSSTRKIKTVPMAKEKKTKKKVTWVLWVNLSVGN